MGEAKNKQTNKQTNKHWDIEIVKFLRFGSHIHHVHERFWRPRMHVVRYDSISETMINRVSYYRLSNDFNEYVRNFRPTNTSLIISFSSTSVLSVPAYWL